MPLGTGCTSRPAAATARRRPIVRRRPAAALPGAGDGAAGACAGVACAGVAGAGAVLPPLHPPGAPQPEPSERLQEAGRGRDRGGREKRGRGGRGGA